MLTYEQTEKLLEIQTKATSKPKQTNWLKLNDLREDGCGGKQKIWINQ